MSEIFGVRKIMGLKNFVFKRIFRSKIIVSPKKFGSTSKCGRKLEKTHSDDSHVVHNEEIIAFKSADEKSPFIIN